MVILLVAVLVIAVLVPLSESRPLATVTVLSAALFETCKTGDLAKVLLLLAAGADRNYEVDVDGPWLGFSPLAVASQRGHLGVMRALLTAGASVNKAESQYGMSSLWIAAAAGRVQSVAFLLSSGAIVNQCTLDGNTALTVASRLGHSRVVELLLTAGADSACAEISTTSSSSSSSSKFSPALNAALLGDALVNASFDGDLRTVIWLLGVGASVTYSAAGGENKGAFPLYAAAGWGHLNVMKALIAAQADPNQREGARTSLYMAAAFNQLDAARLLLSAGAWIDHTSSGGPTPLMVAAERGFLKMLELLLASHPTPNVDHQVQGGATSLFLACGRGNLLVVIALLKAKSDPNLVAKGGVSCLQIAAAHGHLAVVKALLKAGGKLRHVDQSGATALSAAIEGGFTGVETFLRASLAASST